MQKAIHPASADPAERGPTMLKILELMSEESRRAGSRPQGDEMLRVEGRLSRKTMAGWKAHPRRYTVAPTGMTPTSTASNVPVKQNRDPLADPSHRNRRQTDDQLSVESYAGLTRTSKDDQGRHDLKLWEEQEAHLAH